MLVAGSYPLYPLAGDASVAQADQFPNSGAQGTYNATPPRARSDRAAARLSRYGRRLIEPQRLARRGRASAASGRSHREPVQLDRRHAHGCRRCRAASRPSSLECVSRLGSIVICCRAGPARGAHGGYGLDRDPRGAASRAPVRRNQAATSDPLAGVLWSHVAAGETRTGRSGWWDDTSRGTRTQAPGSRYLLLMLGAIGLVHLTFTTCHVLSALDRRKTGTIALAFIGGLAAWSRRARDDVRGDCRRNGARPRRLEADHWHDRRRSPSGRRCCACWYLATEAIDRWSHTLFVERAYSITSGPLAAGRHRGVVLACHVVGTVHRHRLRHVAVRGRLAFASPVGLVGQADRRSTERHRKHDVEGQRQGITHFLMWPSRDMPSKLEWLCIGGVGRGDRRDMVDAAGLARRPVFGWFTQVAWTLAQWLL